MTVTSERQPKFVVFDVEGVLIPKNRFFYLVGKSLGFVHLVKVFFYGFLYETGLIPLKLALRHLFSSVRGMKTERLLEIAANIPLVPEARLLFEKLRAQGFRTAFITSGLPTIVVKVIADKLGADYAVGFDVGLNDDTLTGEIWGDVTERNGKLAVLHRLVDSESLRLSDCAVIADDRNNASLFVRDVLKIGFNPDFVLRVKSDRVVTGGVFKVLTAINGEPKHRGKPTANDVFRELIHASAFFIPVIAGLVDVPLVAASIIVILGLYTMSEYLRTEGKRMPFFSVITRKAASQNELYLVVLAPVYFAVGILLTLVLFPAPLSSAAIAIFALGDSTASIFGRYFSRPTLPFNKDKSVEGSFAGFLFAFLAGWFFVSPWLAVLGAAVAMFVEYLPLPINDNLLMPLCTGLVMTLFVR